MFCGVCSRSLERGGCSVHICSDKKSNWVFAVSRSSRSSAACFHVAFEMVVLLVPFQAHF